MSNAEMNLDNNMNRTDGKKQEVHIVTSVETVIN